MPARVTAKRKKKTVAARKPAKKKAKVMKRAPKVKIVGRVVHYYDRLQVAIVELAAPLRLGDTVLIKHNNQEVFQNVDSLQIDHMSVEQAKKKQVVGLKVNQPVKQGSLVLPA